MKKVSIVVFLLGYCISYGQSYRCFQSGVEHYFLNSDDYLRGIRIDSTIIAGDTTIYYPFRTLRNQSHWPMNDTGGSWLGKKVKECADGTFIFDTYWGNPIILKTQASLGDFWIFYQDTSSRYYGATVTAVDTMTVLGVLDSIKRIKIIAIVGSTITTSDPVNNMELILSKSFGFAKIFDLYMFPYHPDSGAYIYSTDYFYENCGSQIFNIIDLVKPTKMELYDFNVGDYFEYNGTEAVSMDNNAFYVDSVIGKTVVSSGSITYIFKTKRYIEYYGYPGSHALTFGTKLLNVTMAPLFDSRMPEEVGVYDIIHYHPKDSLGCIISPKYDFDMNPWYWDEPCGVYEQYKIGLGKVFFAECLDPTPGPASGDSYHLIYAYKNGVGCGGYHPLPMSVDDVAAPFKETGIYPNPATTELTVYSAGKINKVEIYNTIGQSLFSGQFNDGNVHIDIRHLSPGMYLVRVNSSEVLKFSKQ